VEYLQFDHCRIRNRSEYQRKTIQNNCCTLSNRKSRQNVFFVVFLHVFANASSPSALHTHVKVFDRCYDDEAEAEAGLSAFFLAFQPFSGLYESRRRV
jgi:hypothetical protein